MKKSKAVPATLVIAVAAIILTGCGSSPTEVRRCVDAQGNVLPDAVCSNGGTGSGYSSTYRPYMGTPHWAYGGIMSGSRLSGFHSSPSSGASVHDSAGHSVSRGGFGSHGGGGGEAGG